VSETWSIKVPHRTREDTLIDVAASATSLADDDRRVTQHIVLEAQVAGDRSAGDLLDRLGAMSREARRQVLDDAREASGLPRSEDLDRRQAFVRMQQALPPGRDRMGRAFQTCHAEGCTSHPVGAGGQWVPHPAARWFCEAHRDQAEPGDLDPYEADGWIDFRTMQAIPGRAERKRLAAEQQRLREEDRRRNEAREAEAEAMRRARERYREEHRDDPYAFPPIAGIPQSRFARVNTELSNREQEQGDAP
jgi:hypothetical protein